MTPEYTKSIKLLPRPGQSDYVNTPAEIDSLAEGITKAAAFMGGSNT